MEVWAGAKVITAEAGIGTALAHTTTIFSCPTTCANKVLATETAPVVSPTVGMVSGSSEDVELPDPTSSEASRETAIMGLATPYLVANANVSNGSTTTVKPSWTFHSPKPPSPSAFVNSGSRQCKIGFMCLVMIPPVLGLVF